jgi:hypothetical protein
VLQILDRYQPVLVRIDARSFRLRLIIIRSGVELEPTMQEGLADYLGHLVSDFDGIEELPDDDVEGIGVDLMHMDQSVDIGKSIEHLSIGCDWIPDFDRVLASILLGQLPTHSQPRLRARHHQVGRGGEKGVEALSGLKARKTSIEVKLGLVFIDGYLYDG